MDELKQQLADLEAKKAQLFEQGNVDQVEVSRLNERIKAVQAQIASSITIEEKVHAGGLPFAVSGVDFTKLSAELIEVIELVVKSDRRRIYAEHATEIEQVGNELETTNTALVTLKADHDKLQQDYDTRYVELIDQINETMRMMAERDDARKNRDNAAAQLAEAQTEIARLKSEVADYQNAKVLGEREAQNVIEAAPEEAEAINAAIKKLYASFENYGAINKVIKPDGTYELVKTADLQENWVPEAEVNTPDNSFRDESSQTPEIDTKDGGVLDTEVIAPPEVPTFPEVPDTINTLEGIPANGEVAEKALTIIERVASLEARVRWLELGKADEVA